MEKIVLQYYTNNITWDEYVKMMYTILIRKKTYDIIIIIIYSIHK